MKVNIKSTLESIAQQVFVSTNVRDAKSAIINHIGDTRIKDSDKLTIVNNVNKINSLVRLQTYVCNSLLKYEGLGLK